MDLSNENMVHVKKDDIEYLQFRKLLEFDNLIHCYTMRKNLDFKRTEIDNKNEMLEASYRRICNAVGLDRKNEVRPYQTHTDCVKAVDKGGEKLSQVDGLVTDKTDVDLVLTFADCTPIFLYDPIKKVISNIHSGWRGTAQKIGQKGVLKMVKDYSCNPKDIIACIGPCIGKCHFEVEEDVKDIFEKNFSYLNVNSDIIKMQDIKVEGKQKYNIDTTLINRLILQEAGILPENIFESNICTVCNSNLIHSYRAEKEKSGRNIAVLGMRNKLWKN